MTSNVDNRGQGAREHHTAQISFISIDVNFSNFVASGFTAIGKVPAGARILSAYSVTQTAFNAQTNNGFSIGVTTGGAEIAANVTTLLAAAGTKPVTITNAAAGPFITADTILYAVASFSGTAATAGNSDIIVAYSTVHGAQDSF